MLLFVAVNLFFWYLVLKDSPGTRALIPWAFLVAAIVNLLIFIWIIYYIEAVYPGDKVYVEKPRGMGSDDDEFGHQRFDEGEEDSPKKKKHDKYRKQSKGAYLLDKTLGPIINFLCFLLFWCVANDWVEKHENQQTAYG